MLSLWPKYRDGTLTQWITPCLFSHEGLKYFTCRFCAICSCYNAFVGVTCSHNFYNDQPNAYELRYSGSGHSHATLHWSNGHSGQFSCDQMRRESYIPLWKNAVNNYQCAFGIPLLASFLVHFLHNPAILFSATLFMCPFFSLLLCSLPCCTLPLLEICGGSHFHWRRRPTASPLHSAAVA